MKKERIVVYLPQKIIDQAEKLQKQSEIMPTMTAVYEYLIIKGLDAQKAQQKE